MSIQEKILKALGVTKEEYDKELAKHEYERVKAMGCVGDYITGREGQMATGEIYITAEQARQQAQMAQLQNQYAQLQNQYNQQLQLANAAGSGAFGQYAAQQTQPINYRRTIGSIPKGGTPTFEQLEDPDSPFNLSLEALSNMWGARFGYRWVKDEDTADAVEENEEMWGFVVSRLLKTGLLVSQQYLHPDKIGVGQAWKLIEKDYGNS